MIEKEVILKKYTGKNEHHKDKTPDLFTCFLIYDAMEEYARLYHDELCKQLNEETRKDFGKRKCEHWINDKCELEHCAYMSNASIICH